MHSYKKSVPSSTSEASHCFSLEEKNGCSNSLSNASAQSKALESASVSQKHQSHTSQDSSVSESFVAKSDNMPAFMNIVGLDGCSDTEALAESKTSSHAHQAQTIAQPFSNPTSNISPTPHSALNTATKKDNAANIADTASGGSQSNSHRIPSDLHLMTREYPQEWKRTIPQDGLCWYQLPRKENASYSTYDPDAFLKFRNQLFEELKVLLVAMPEQHQDNPYPIPWGLNMVLSKIQDEFEDMMIKRFISEPMSKESKQTTKKRSRNTASAVATTYPPIDAETFVSSDFPYPGTAQSAFQNPYGFQAQPGSTMLNAPTANISTTFYDVSNPISNIAEFTPSIVPSSSNEFGGSSSMAKTLTSQQRYSPTTSVAGRVTSIDSSLIDPALINIGVSSSSQTSSHRNNPGDTHNPVVPHSTAQSLQSHGGSRRPNLSGIGAYYAAQSIEQNRNYAAEQARGALLLSKQQGPNDFQGMGEPSAEQLAATRREQQEFLKHQYLRALHTTALHAGMILPAGSPYYSNTGPTAPALSYNPSVGSYSTPARTVSGQIGMDTSTSPLRAQSMLVPGQNTGRESTQDALQRQHMQQVASRQLQQQQERLSAMVAGYGHQQPVSSPYHAAGTYLVPVLPHQILRSQRDIVSPISEATALPSQPQPRGLSSSQTPSRKAGTKRKAAASASEPKPAKKNKTKLPNPGVIASTPAKQGDE